MVRNLDPSASVVLRQWQASRITSFTCQAASTFRLEGSLRVSLGSTRRESTRNGGNRRLATPTATKYFISWCGMCSYRSGRRKLFYACMGKVASAARAPFHVFRNACYAQRHARCVKLLYLLVRNVQIPKWKEETVPSLIRLGTISPSTPGNRRWKSVLNHVSEESASRV